MKLSLVRIGNSQGLRLPQALIKECAFGPEVEVMVKNKVMTIRAAETIRAEWDDFVATENKQEPINPAGEWEW